MTLGIKSDSRHGAVLAVTLVCLLVVAAVSSLLLRSLLAQQRKTQRLQVQLQALWLAESALDRAAVRLATDANYVGEVWRIEAEELAAASPGSVRIQIETIDEDESLRRVAVEARYPEDSERRIVQLRSALLRLASVEQ